MDFVVFVILVSIRKCKGSFHKYFSVLEILEAVVQIHSFTNRNFGNLNNIGKIGMIRSEAVVFYKVTVTSRPMY